MKSAHTRGRARRAETARAAPQAAARAGAGRHSGGRSARRSAFHPTLGGARRASPRPPHTAQSGRREAQARRWRPPWRCRRPDPRAGDRRPRRQRDGRRDSEARRGDSAAGRTPCPPASGAARRHSRNRGAARPWRRGAADPRTARGGTAPGRGSAGQPAACCARGRAPPARERAPCCADRFPWQPPVQSSPSMASKSASAPPGESTCR